ncbi:MAG: hypothetical protein AAGF67_06220 [Verrucomicrobiota bacterium]
MNRLFLALCTAGLTLTGFSSAVAEEVRSYNLVLPDGSSIPTTIIWKNIQGLDTIRGDFHYAAGELSFTGKNSASGFLWMNDENGSYYEFRKEKSGNSFRWVGTSAVGERLVLVPTGSPAPKPKPSGGPSGTVRNYTYIPEGDGTPFPVTIVWDNIEGLGNINGYMTYPNGRRVHFSGSNPESGFITFTDSEGAVFSLWKRTRGDSFEWAGTGADNAAPFKVTLVPAKGGGAAAAPKPPAPAGNGETVRQYTMTGPFGQKYPATIIWSNIKGLGPIKGSLFSPGENLTISGQNSRSGFIFFSDQYGTYYELNKQAPAGGKVHWKGTATFPDNSVRQVDLKGN